MEQLAIDMINATSFTVRAISNLLMKKGIYTSEEIIEEVAAVIRESKLQTVKKDNSSVDLDKYLWEGHINQF